MIRRAARAAADRLRRGDDAGLTLVEVMVSVSLMSVVTVLFTTAILQIYRSVVSTESMASTQSQVNTAFLRLDREVRYATAIKVAAGTPASMELLTDTTGAQVCTQLWLTGGRLKRRTWTETAASSTPLNQTGWLVVASQVSSTQPFQVLPADETRAFQRLRVRLTATAVGGAQGTTRLTDVTFTALNSNPDTDLTVVCTKGGAL